MKLIGFVIGVVTVALVQGREFDDFKLVHHRLPPPSWPDSKAAVPQWGTITQKLDNFNSNDQRTWSMRYIENGQWFQSGGPIFIMLGAEWTIDSGWIMSGQMYDMARQNKAYMYYTEHRYYGQSIPTNDLSVQNLKYLTTPQALEDVAVFIRSLKKNPDFVNSKVIVFGGSYGGNMAIWMREKYPDLVHAALSSSAPVKAEVDFKEYFEVVQTALGTPQCYGVITNAVKEIQRLFKTGSAGIRKVQADYKLCQPVDTNDFYDTAYFFNSIANEFAGIVQYAGGNDLKSTCDQLEFGGGDDYSRLASFVSRRRPYCVGNYDNFVSYFQQNNLQGDSRQWLYQTCNEYGYFQSSDSNDQPFGDTFPVDMNFKMCTDIFGMNFDESHVNEAAAATNANYGAWNPDVTRVISIHGSLDPWHALGLSQDVNSDAPVIVVPGTSHCGDMQSVNLYDSQEMKATKLREQELIKKWLSES